MNFKNAFFEVTYDTDAGKLTVARHGVVMLVDAVACARTDLGTRNSSEPAYTRTSRVEPLDDELGTGQRIAIECIDARGELDIEIRAAVYEQRDLLVLEALCRNPSATEGRTVHCLDPIRAFPAEGGGFMWHGATKVLTNGKSFQSPGYLQDLNPRQPRPVLSSWNIAVSSGGPDGHGLTLGFLECRRAEGVVALAHDEDSILTDWSGRDDLLQLSAEAWFRAGGVLAPGASISSGRLAFVCAADPADALTDYAQAIADVHDVRVKPSPTGWTHWFYTHEYIDEAEILANAKFIARNAAGYGIDYVQVDSGYQAAYGEWDGNERFPHGMKWLADQLRDLGLKPGIWIAPFLISEGTEIAERHPDWLLRDPDGTVKKCGGGLTSDLSAPGFGEWGCPSLASRLFGLDVTHPDAAAWLHDLFDTVANEWGYEFIKVDHLDWSLLAADAYWDRAYTRAAAHRRAFEIMRDAVGRDKHLLVCGPALPVAGLVDSTRIDQDLAELSWEQYARHSNSSGPSMAKRGCFHGRTWINDPDQLGVAQLSIAEAQAAATLIALSGGTTFLGDRLIDLDAVRLDILKRVLPAYGQAARPVDLFESDRPQIFVLPLNTSFAEWTVVALFNYDEHTTTERDIALEALGLDPSRAYVAYDFWGQRSVGELRDKLRLRLDPASVTVLSVHEKRSVPHLLSTDRHVTQGAVELETVVWDDELAALTGVSLGPLGTAHSVAIAVPSGYAWADHSRFFAERGAYSLKLVEADVLRVRPRFDTCERVEWTVEFRRVDEAAGQQDQRQIRTPNSRIDSDIPQVIHPRRTEIT